MDDIAMLSRLLSPHVLSAPRLCGKIPSLLCALMMVGAVTLNVVAPAPAQAAPAQAAKDDARQAKAFVSDLSTQAFAILRDKTLNRAQAMTRLRSLLEAHFAVDAIGNKLIRRYQAKATPQQLETYHRIFPDWVVATYADRLFPFAKDKLKIVRAQKRGRRFVDVTSTMILHDKGTRIAAIWRVKKGDDGRWLISNLILNGINLTLTQTADFSAYIQKNGFDALLSFMQEKVTSSQKEAENSGAKK